MFIRTFIEAETKMEAEEHLKNLFALAEKVHLILEVNSFERYWKFNDSFRIEIDGTSPTDIQLNKFLEGIATKWSSFFNSYLAAKTLEGCTILSQRGWIFTCIIN